MHHEAEQKVAGVVILYHPDEKVVENIRSYYNALDRLFVVDNTPSGCKPHIQNKIEELPNVAWISNQQNRGIAEPLNDVLAKVDGRFFWLLTMDQDSSFLDGQAEVYIKACSKFYSNHKDVWGFTPNLCADTRKSEEENSTFQEVNLCITSGNFLRVDVAVQANGWDETLFIDEVDSDFCLRLAQSGGRLFRYNPYVLQHQLGEKKEAKVLGHHLFFYYNHNYVRLYYMFRNSLYVAKKHPSYRRERRIAIAKEFLKIILAEKDKWRKVKYILKGIMDYRGNRMGKLQEISDR